MLPVDTFLKGERDQMLWGKQNVQSRPHAIDARTSHACEVLTGVVGNLLPRSGRLFTC